VRPYQIQLKVWLYLIQQKAPVVTVPTENRLYLIQQKVMVVPDSTESMAVHNDKDKIKYSWSKSGISSFSNNTKIFFFDFGDNLILHGKWIHDPQKTKTV